MSDLIAQLQAGRWDGKQLSPLFVMVKAQRIGINLNRQSAIELLHRMELI